VSLLKTRPARLTAVALSYARSRSRHDELIHFGQKKFALVA